MIVLLSLNFVVAGDLNETDSSTMMNCESIPVDLTSGENEQNQVNFDEDSAEVMEDSGDGLNHIYVSPSGSGSNGSQETPGDFKTTINSIQDNTVVHMLDGDYTWTSANKNDVIKISSKNNITIIADNPGKVTLTSTSAVSSTKEFQLSSSNNIFIKNIIFKPATSATYLFEIKTSNNIFFENCEFTNWNGYDIIIYSLSNTTMYDCRFINNTVNKAVLGITDQNSIYFIKNCTFNNTKAFYNINLNSKSTDIIECKFFNFTPKSSTSINIKIAGKNNYISNVNISSCYFDDNCLDFQVSDVNVNTNSVLFFKNNTIKSQNAIQVSNGGKINIVSPTTLTVLNNTQLTATSGDIINITAVLVDDMGNYINIPKIDFSIEGVTYSATYKDGVYSVAYTVPEVTHPEEISFDSTPESTYLGDLTVKYQPLFLLAKPALNMTMSNVSDSVYGDNVTVKVNISNLESGNLIYQFIKDDVVVKTVTDSFSNNMSTVSVNDLPAGDYTVAVKYAEDDNFGATTITKTFTVSKANSTVQILIDPTIPVGDNITVQAIVPANAGGNVTFRLNTDNKTVNVTDKAVFDALANGTYIIYAVYNGDDNYNPSEEVNVTFEVVKVNPTINIEYSTPVINENVTVTVTMNEDINGDVNVTINKLDPVVEHVVNGILVFNITNVPYGPQNITVSFTGNDKYNAGEKNASFFVNKLDVDLSISAVAITYGEPLVVIVNANEKFTGEVIVKIGTLNQTANIVNGKGNATFNNLSADDYFITATFTEDETFYSDSANTTVTVNGVEVPVDQALDINVPANSQSPTFSITLYPDATGNFTVSVDGVVVDTRELVNGSASITVKDLAVGNHNVSVIYSGDGKYAPITQNTTLSISKIATGISASKVTAVYLTSKKLVVTLKDKAGNILTGMKVTVKVGSISKTLTTDSKGQVSVDVSKLVPKTYTAKFTFAGDDKYLKSEGSASVKINKAASKITAKKKTFKAKKKTKKYTITLKSGKKAIGKVKVTIKIGKKTYTAKTNKKGKATFKVKKLTKKAKYNAVIKFKGNKYYKATTKKVKIVLK